MLQQYHLLKQRLLRASLALGLISLLAVAGQAQTISAVAGNGTSTTTDSGIGAVQGVAVDGDGNIYVAASTSQVVRKITPQGVYSTFAGTGTQGYTGDGGPATSATLYSPVDVYVIGNALYIADNGNGVIRKVDLATNIITSVGTAPKPQTLAQGVAVDGNGDVYVAANTKQVVYKVASDGTYTTFAGTGTQGYAGDGGPATSAKLYNPVDLSVSGNSLYIAEIGNRRVRKIDLSTNIITTVAGDGTTNITGAGIGYVQGIAVDAGGTMFVAAGNAHVIRKITADGTYSTIAGTGTAGNTGDGGDATQAQLNNPVDVYLAGRDLYLVQSGNYLIRKVTNVVAATPLPVELVSFTAEYQATAGVLRWETASEQRSAYFLVERSLDGHAFSPVAQVPAHGTSAQVHAYQAVDNRLTDCPTEQVYYRLRQVDTDGTATYSPVRLLAVPVVSTLAAQAYPNPATTTTLRVMVHTPTTGPATLTVTDATGTTKLVRHEVWAKGNTTLELPEAAHWAAGMYLVRLTQGQQQQTIKITCN